MHDRSLHLWQHEHVFGQDRKRPGEVRTLVVIAITGTMMVVEIAAGALFGSMALFADGLHMATHAAALTINALAYVYARRHAGDARYSFGTGKVNALGGFVGAILLAVFALLMVWESGERLLHPVAIAFDQAIAVAVLGLVVNGVSVFVLGHHGPGGHHHHHGPGAHSHVRHRAAPHKYQRRRSVLHGPHGPGAHAHTHSRGEDHAHHDHNLRSAYLHVLADALTSLLAIFALLVAKYYGLTWMDPLMGILGAVLVARWSVGLLRQTSGVLLDREGPERVRERIKECVESDGDSRVADLHLWSIGPDIYGVIVSVVAHEPQAPEDYKERIPRGLGLEHVTVEVHQCAEEELVEHKG